VRIVFRKYLLVMSDEAFATSDFEMVYVRLMRLVAQCKIAQFAVPVNNMLRVDLLQHWEKRGRRHRAFWRCLLKMLDATMVAIHSAIFR
jgi:hypothetical protein